MSAIEELMREFGSEGKETLLLIRELAGFVANYRRMLEKFELDTLTGLPGSNKYIEYKADLEKRPPSGVGVIVFDVNDLKYYNDNKGHQAGDLLLQKAAESFHHISGECGGGGAVCGDSVDTEKFRSIRRNARVFRTGGDEFVALITDCVPGDVDIIVAEWLARLTELNSVNDGIQCTIAWGSAYGSGEYRLGDVLMLADERMYAEKRRMKESGLKLGDVR